MSIEKTLEKDLQKALKNIYGQTIPLAKLALTPTPPHFMGSHTLTTFPLAAPLHTTPHQIAQQLGAWLVAHNNAVASYQIVKGFLNLELTDSVWLDQLKKLTNTMQDRLPATGQTVLIEFSQPNTNKPQHLGHLRNNFLGHALAQLLEAVGHRVYKVNIVNDRGIHICKSMLAYQKWGGGETPTSTGMKGDHFVGKYYVRFEKAYQQQVQQLTTKLVSAEEAKKKAPLLQEAQKMLQAWEQGDKDVMNLWRRMNNWVYEGFDATYKKIGITFDQVDYESKTYLAGKKIVKEGLAKNLFYQKQEGSIWTDLQAEGLDQKLLLRADGTSVYITQDMGLIDTRYQKYHFHKHLYVVGNEQDYHFRVLFKVMQQLGKPYANKLEHLSYGMVHLPTGKMKSREGTTVDADTLIDEMLEVARRQTALLGKTENFSQETLEKLVHTIAIGALKYFLLKVTPSKNILFDPTTSIDLQGHTAAFIQYTHARIHTLLIKSQTVPNSTSWMQINPYLTPIEKKLVIQLTSFSTHIEQAANTYNPALLATYCYELAKMYNRFYTISPILQATNTNLCKKRIYLSYTTAYILKKAMGLLGITLPNSM